MVAKGEAGGSGKKFLPVAKKAYGAYGPCLFLQPHLCISHFAHYLPVILTTISSKHQAFTSRLLHLSAQDALPFFTRLHCSLASDLSFNVTSSKKSLDYSRK